jgi:hypothetical protein
MDLSQSISLTIQCKHLHSSDVFSKSDPYAKLALKTSGRWQDLGRTETLQNDHNPKFTKEFIVTYRFEEVQECLVTIMDDDYGKTNDDLLGQASFVLGTLMGSRGQKIRIPLRNTSGRLNGEVIISATEGVTGGGDELIAIFACRNLDKKDWGPFSSSDPFFIIETLSSASSTNHTTTAQNEEWTPIYRSEEIKKNLNPQWKQFSIPVRKLHGGNRLRIAIYDWDWDGSHDLIGYVDPITLPDIVAVQKKGLNVVHPPTKSKYQSSKYTSSGLFDIVSARLEKGDPTFVEYLRSGLQIGLSVAIDFTGSNGSPDTPGTLHYGHGRTAVSPYMAAIAGVGNIVLDYDADKLVPTFGFGARPTPTQPVNHCFPLNGNMRNPEVYGIEGIIEAYATTFDHGVVLSGPTHFAPVIRQVANMSKSSTYSYSILLLITDGAINDMQETIDAIVETSLACPLSIIIVGVGNADFSSMQALDADVQPLISSKGTLCQRDIVQFVPFNKCGGDAGLLAKETLAELPGQIVYWFWTMKRQRPGRSIETSDSDAKLIEAEIQTTPIFNHNNKASVSAPPLLPLLPPRFTSSAPPLIPQVLSESTTTTTTTSSLGEIGRSLLQTTL